MKKALVQNTIREVKTINGKEYCNIQGRYYEIVNGKIYGMFNLAGEADVEMIKEVSTFTTMILSALISITLLSTFIVLCVQYMIGE